MAQLGSSFFARGAQRTSTLAWLALTTAVITGCARNAGTLEGAQLALGSQRLQTIEFSATGRWFQFGQAPNPSLPWPPFDVSSYTATIDYQAPAARVQIVRKQVIEPERNRPTPVEQKPDQYVSGTNAWNLAPPQGAPPDAPAVPQPQPAAVAERVAEIWSTPQGFLKAAAAHQAITESESQGLRVTFTVDKQRYVGLINAANEVASVQTWIATPVLGDTLVETTFSDYRDFSGVRFPAHIQRTQGGHPVLDLNVVTVTANAPAAIETPEQVVAAAQPVAVTAEQLAAGVFYLRGGTHHSVAIDQGEQVVLVEAPQNEERSQAVIAKVAEILPGKPIRFLVNTHHHFDHSGGLRSYVVRGVTIVTHAINRPYYEQAWANPRTLEPDSLAAAGSKPEFETFTDKLVLNDDSHPVEIHTLEGNAHHDGFALVYLPQQKILIEADAFTPAAAGAPPPAAPNPYSVNLYENIQRLKLEVTQIAALHGPRITTLEDLRTAIGQASPPVSSKRT